MPLRKPSEYFIDIDPKTTLDYVQEELNSASPEKIEKISKAFDSYKNNLNHLQALTDFTETFDSFKSSISKINDLSYVIDSLKNEIANFIKKEDLDNAMMSHLFFVDESIKNIQDNIKTLNSKTLFNIREEFYTLSNLVENFLNVDVINYKNTISETEIRIDKRFKNYKNDINEKIENIDKGIADKLLLITETVEGINEVNLSSIKENILDIDDKLNSTLKIELPKYKKLFAETELKTEKRIFESETYFEKKYEEIENNYQTKIEQIKNDLNYFVESEIPKYKNMLIESSLKSEEEVKKISVDVEKNINDISEYVKNLEQKIKNKEIDITQNLEKNLFTVESFVNECREEISSISRTYENLHKDFKRREILESKKLEIQAEKLNDFSEKLFNLENVLTKDISTVQKNLNISTSNYYDVLKSEVGFFEQNISDKIKDLEINFYRNEKHIQDAKNVLKETLSRIKFEEIEKKNTEITEKISKLESILEKFDEKKLLTEDLTGSSSTKTKDPLTPLNQDFVTLKDLKEHYRIFINRIQQQLASIGGGGAGFIKDLADVSFDESTGENKLLIYNGNNWVGIASTSLGGVNALTNLTDVNSSNLGDGRFLRYDASTSKFTFAPVSASNLELIAGDIQSGILTTSGIGTAVIMSISASTYRSANYQVQVTEGSNYNMTTINVIHDGINTYMTEYGTINHPIGVATFSSEISAGSLRLLAYPSFASATTFKIVFTAIET